MKCPSCQKNHKYSDGMKCGCGYWFALDPKTDKVTDGKFASYIRAASSNNTYFFTENQLYTAALRKRYFSGLPFYAALISFIVALGLANVFASAVFSVIWIVSAILICIFGAKHFGYFLPRDKFYTLRHKYQARRGQIEKLISMPTLHEPPPEWKEPDIYDYGVERILVVQHDLLVDLFVLNDLHSTNRALVVSSGNYPSYLSVHVDRLLSQSRELPVFLLHDANEEGMRWVTSQQQSSRFNNGQRQIIDLGMYPENLRRIKKLKALRLSKDGDAGPIDILPMAMLGSGLAMSMDQGISLGELLIISESPDTSSSASFG